MITRIYNAHKKIVPLDRRRKLTEDQKLAIRVSSATTKSLAIDYGVHYTTVRSIQNGTYNL